MGDCEYVALQLEGEENLIAAAKHIVRALGSNKNLTKDVKKILADVGAQLSNMATIDDTMVEDGKSGIEEQLSIVQEKILSWVVDESMTWCWGPDEVAEYLTAADEARKLTERLKNQCLNSEEDKELLRRALDVLQMAMLRLEKEFKHMLLQHKRPFEPEIMSFCSSEDVSVDESSIISCADDSSFGRTSEEFVIDLVHPYVIPDLKCIARLMFMSNYDHECCQAYVIARKEALDECLFNLEMEKLSIEDVHKMERGILNFKIKRWVRAIKIFVRPYLANEKWLCDQIFADAGSASLVCFVEVAKALMLQLQNYAEAISIGCRQPENLVLILDMYNDLLPQIDALFLDVAGSSIRTEYHEVWKRLGDSVRVALLAFENVVSSNPFAGGGTHPLTRYIMNYIQLLATSNHTFNLLPKNQDGATVSPLSPNTSPATEVESMSKDFSGSCSPIALHFQSLTSNLEVSLHDISKLYTDSSLQYLFLMNNIRYMVQNVENSGLGHIFGDERIHKHNRKIRKHATDYERATWSSILSLLKDESNSSSSSISRTLLKERLRSFYVAFKEVYKTQTAWIISDVQLREDLRISTSLKVIQAYRTFVGRQMHHIGEKHIRYNAEDLQDYLFDFFEGIPKIIA
ncbi:Exocyst complex protein Exo70 [Corchorus olitorius]|uniref:Exocyst subunit Exo70 family protein n=1 Tax=Corchorus olitorius TaxID=93759 RepID=A0A1R3ITH9_9ROSI|nr:Exocyst complex protein Exo70 [Corchorus olitorius]